MPRESRREPAGQSELPIVNCEGKEKVGSLGAPYVGSWLSLKIAGGEPSLKRTGGGARCMLPA
jgi:hypothetical protein